MNDPSHKRDKHSEALQYWEARYRDNPRPWTGRPNALLARWVQVQALTPGTALDLGCSEGNSAVWMATQGWQVTGADISKTALERADRHAAQAGVTDRTTFEQHDLEHSFPAGQFDLVYALYLQSPVAFARDLVLRKASDAVQPGGLLLVIEHASGPSWSSKVVPYPTVQEALDTIGLNLDLWDVILQDTVERALTEMTGPNGEVGTTKDNILALRRKHEQKR
ncbi:class I SAM-dependent methyltransferase [Deinococcus multiflagellatus]|uniref:Class I SAM-dependent methyltransferase n=1 Tax=Deinococcus multiflagellatus TaxID=1656887 RepID=A0ABW1ZS57_9DEIO|nr:class I SAM-dependent methyltransferase [Deinococcus multiflagellatus]MBZ9715439.1 class I SAM-dependent methyltransferase [Deinococcus multiflagellatus]